MFESIVHRMAWIGCTFVVVLWLPVATAAEQRPATGSTRKVETLSAKTYQRLNKIQALIDQANYDRALVQLQQLLPTVQRKTYDRAVVLQNLGYVYSAKEDYRNAIPRFEDSLALNVLPAGVQNRMRYDLAQLYVAMEAHEKAVKLLELWFSKVERPPAASYALLGSAYAQLKQYEKAVKPLSRAVEIAKQPQQAWYQLLLAARYELKQYSACVKILKKMVRLFPDKKNYWKQLASMHLMVKQDRRAVAVLELAYRRGMLTESDELVQLAQMWMYLDIPFKAGGLLEQALKSGRVEGTRKTWEMLANIWARAGEQDKELAALQRAADLATDNAELLVRLARLLIEEQRWQETVEILQGALDKSKFADEGDALLLLGTAHYELKAFDQARQAFRQALRIESSRKAAKQWLNYLDANQTLKVSASSG